MINLRLKDISEWPPLVTKLGRGQELMMTFQVLRWKKRQEPSLFNIKKAVSPSCHRKDDFMETSSC